MDLFIMGCSFEIFESIKTHAAGGTPHGVRSKADFQLVSCAPMSPALPVEEAETSERLRFVNSARASYNFPALTM
jgi:hypothetical protein